MTHRRTRNRNNVAWNRVEVCHRCSAEAATTLIRLSTGMIGRVCPHCRACRRVRPFATKQEYEALIHNAAAVAIGGKHVNKKPE